MMMLHGFRTDWPILLTLTVWLWSNMEVLVARISLKRQPPPQQQQQEHVVLHWSRGFKGCFFGLVIHLGIAIFFVLIYVWCFNLYLCSYGREFAQRQLLRSTSLPRIGSTFSLVLFVRFFPIFINHLRWWFWLLTVILHVVVSLLCK